jgi:hypothetical protein
MTTRVNELMLINTRKFVRDRHGKGKWDEVLEAMDEGTRVTFGRELDPSGWVDFEIIHDLLRSVSLVLARNDEHVMRSLGLHNAEANLRITQKILMKILTIKMVLRIASILWTGRVKDGGEMRVVSTGHTSAHCRIEYPPDASEHWWKYLAGWFQRTIELAGGRNVRSQWTGGGGADGETAEFDVSWS